MSPLVAEPILDQTPVSVDQILQSVTPHSLPEATATPQPRWPQKTRALRGVQIVATGAYVPEQIVTNEMLRQQRGFDPAWIEQRSGVLARHVAAPGQATSDLCLEAAKRAMRSAGVTAADIDLVVVGTFTPDYLCPSTANLVQHKLGIVGPAFDVAAACSGFVYALATAAQFVATGNSEMALVIGGDCNTRIVDPNDQKIAPLFGDGAGAVLVTKGDQEQGLICYQLGSDGGGSVLLDRPSGGSLCPTTSEDLAAGRQYMRMEGKKVFKWACEALLESIQLVLRTTGRTVDDVDLYLLHQANIRIINNAAEHLKLPADRIVNNLHRCGNTSAASIPLALDEACRAGRVKRGDNLLLSGFGAGLTWGTGLFRW